MKACLCTHYGPPEEMEVRDVPSPKPDKGQVVVTRESLRRELSRRADDPGQIPVQAALPFRARRRNRRHGEGNRRRREQCEGGRPRDACPSASAALRKKRWPMRAAADSDAGQCAISTVASSFIVTYGTTYHALKDRADLKAGENLVVLGAAGGVGLSAVEIGKAMGARVIAGASSAGKSRSRQEARRR